MRQVLGILIMILLSGHAFGQDNDVQDYAQDSGSTKSRTARSRRTEDKLSAADYQRLTVSGPIVIIDFYAPWCGPCKYMEPMLEELAEENKGKVEVVRINIDDNRNLIHSMDISEIPAVKIYKNGKEAWSRVGVFEKRVIKKQLNRL
jgi:thioredoxin